MGKKHIQGGKEMNASARKETHTGWEGNAYRVGRKHIHGGKEMHTRTGWNDSFNVLFKNYKLYLYLK